MVLLASLMSEASTFFGWYGRTTPCRRRREGQEREGLFLLFPSHPTRGSEERREVPSAGPGAEYWSKTNLVHFLSYTHLVEENFSLFTGNYSGTNKPTNLIKESAENHKSSSI